MNNGFNPPGLIVLASSEVPNSVRPGGRHEATLYERKNAFVFAAGTITASTSERNRSWLK